MNEAPPPNKLWCLIKLFFGFPLAALCLGALFTDGFQGGAIAGTIGFFMGIGVRLAVTGALGVMGQRMSNKASWGLALAVLIGCVLVGPGLSRSSRKSAEAEAWAKVKDSQEVAAWTHYLGEFNQEAAVFRNPEWEGRMALAEAAEAREKKDAGKLREVLKRAKEHKTDAVWQPAAKEATEGLGELFASAVKNLSRKGADPQLQKAFARIVEDLSQHEDGKIYLVFKTDSNMAAPAGDAGALADIRSEPAVKASFPKGNAPVIQVGETFSHAYDLKREALLAKVLQTSFAAVFPAGLLEITPLPDKESHKDKLIMEISNQVTRDQGYYSRSRNNKVLGLMFGLVIDWDFKLYDRGGKQLFLGEARSTPATNVRFQLAEDDPEWAPYGIMVNSAYYNFGRKVTRGFGLTPPPEKTAFQLDER